MLRQFSVFLRLSSSWCGRPWLLHFCDPFKPKCTLYLFKRSKPKNCFDRFPGSDLSGRRGLCSPVSMEACCQDLGSAWATMISLWALFVSAKIEVDFLWVRSKHGSIPTAQYLGGCLTGKSLAEDPFKASLKKSPLVGDFLWRKQSLPMLRR